MRTAGALFGAAAPDLTFIVVAAPDRYLTRDGWWRDREGRKTFLTEWLKTVAGWFKNMTGGLSQGQVSMTAPWRSRLGKGY